MLMRVAPVVFVLLWSTGFIGSKLGAPYAEPFTFLALRFVLVLALLAPVAALTGNFARDWGERANSMVVGMLIHGVYLGGVFWSIRHGMPAGVSALIVSLQPILTALLSAPLLGENLSARHWLGLGLGLVGAVMVLQPGLAHTLDASSGITAATIGANVVALFGITAATIYEKRTSTDTNLLAGTVWQYVGAVLLVGLSCSKPGSFIGPRVSCSRSAGWSLSCRSVRSCCSCC
jgi:drug/metabolite transporter (DMT)-like permease